MRISVASVEISRVRYVFIAAFDADVMFLLMKPIVVSAFSRTLSA